MPLEILHRLVGRPKRTFAVEPRRLGPFPRLYPAADPFSYDHDKTPRRNNENTHTISLRRASAWFCLPALAPQKETVDPKIEQQIRVKKLIQVRS